MRLCVSAAHEEAALPKGKTRHMVVASPCNAQLATISRRILTFDVDFGGAWFVALVLVPPRSSLLHESPSIVVGYQVPTDVKNEILSISHASRFQ
jgi:hypothetical protein